MPENGLTPAAKRRQEFVDAEAALRARPRSAEEIAGDLTPAEEAEIVAQDERLAAARAATQAAQTALAAAHGPGLLTRDAGRVAVLHGAKALTVATGDEQDARRDYLRLHERIGASRQARRQEAAR